MILAPNPLAVDNSLHLLWDLYRIVLSKCSCLNKYAPWQPTLKFWWNRPQKQVKMGENCRCCSLGFPWSPLGVCQHAGSVYSGLYSMWVSMVIHVRNTCIGSNLPEAAYTNVRGYGNTGLVFIVWHNNCNLSQSLIYPQVLLEVSPYVPHLFRTLNQGEWKKSPDSR